MKNYDVAVIGGGYCGLMVLANLVRFGPSNAKYVIFEPRPHIGPGLAYSTYDPQHLLNVRARGMSAWPDQPDDFVQWLNTDSGRSSLASSGILQTPTPIDFLPRQVYGAYLQHIWTETIAQAAHKNIHIQHVRNRAETVGLSTAGEFQIIDTAQQKSSAVSLVIALGNPQSIEHPTTVWDRPAAQLDLDPERSVAIAGTGLSAIDHVLTLHHSGLKGPVYAVSRRAYIPHAHDVTPARTVPDLKPQDIPQTVYKLWGLFQQSLAQAPNFQATWQDVIESWRPHLPQLWAGLSIRERQKFLHRVFPIWNIHRHRMAPEIAQKIAALRASGWLRIIKARYDSDQHVIVAPNGQEAISDLQKIYDCRGFDFRLNQNQNSLLQSLFAQELIRPHATGWGLAVTHEFRSDLSGSSSNVPRPYIIGPLGLGEFLESTAVPELRNQAKLCAQQIIASWPLEQARRQHSAVA